MEVVEFRSKLNIEPKQIVFVEKTYTLKTDHKTGLLIQKLLSEKATDTTDDKLISLALGEKQAKELMEEIEAAGEKDGCAINYTENKNAIVFGIMSVLYNKPYEDFEKAYDEDKGKK